MSELAGAEISVPEVSAPEVSAPASDGSGDRERTAASDTQTAPETGAGSQRDEPGETGPAEPAGASANMDGQRTERSGEQGETASGTATEPGETGPAEEAAQDSRQETAAARAAEAEPVTEPPTPPESEMPPGSETPAEPEIAEADSALPEPGEPGEHGPAEPVASESAEQITASDEPGIREPAEEGDTEPEAARELADDQDTDQTAEPSSPEESAEEAEEPADEAEDERPEADLSGEDKPASESADEVAREPRPEELDQDPAEGETGVEAVDSSPELAGEADSRERADAQDISEVVHDDEPPGQSAEGSNAGAADIGARARWRDLPVIDDFGERDVRRHAKVPRADERPQRAYELRGSDRPLSGRQSYQIARGQDKVASLLDQAKGRELTAAEVQDAIKHANPTQGRNRNNNCVECSMGVDDMLRGHPAAAGPTPGQTLGHADNALMPRATSRHDRISASQIESMLRNAGPGSRGVIIGRHRLGGLHAWNVANIGGKIYHIDGQDGTMSDINTSRAIYIFYRTA